MSYVEYDISYSTIDSIFSKKKKKKFVEQNALENKRPLK